MNSIQGQKCPPEILLLGKLLSFKFEAGAGAKFAETNFCISENDGDHGFLVLSLGIGHISENDGDHGFLVLSSGVSARRWKYSEKPGSCRLIIDK